jgi:hypothetical protein
VQRSTTQQRWQNIHPTNTTNTAKHPPKTITATQRRRQSICQSKQRNDGKASTRRRPMQPEPGGRDKAKEGAEAGTPREKPTTTAKIGKRGRRPPRSHRQPAEFPRRRLKGGSDAKGTVVVRPTRSRFSFGNHTREERGGGESDAFRNVNGVRGRWRHRPAGRPKALACTPLPLQSRRNPQSVIMEPKSAATTQTGTARQPQSHRREGKP